MKTPASPAMFQPVSGATAITPQRGSLLTGATSVRPIYPTTPVSVSSVVPSPAPPVAPIVSAPGVSAVAAAAAVAPAAVSPSPSSQMNQPFFPVSQIRSYLSTQLSQSSIAMISDEAINCMAHGLDAFLRSILTRVSVVAGHKAVKLSEDPHLTQVDFAREQLNYLQRLGEFDRQKQSELEKEYILKAAKVGSSYLNMILLGNQCAFATSQVPHLGYNVKRSLCCFHWLLKHHPLGGGNYIDISNRSPNSNISTIIGVPLTLQFPIVDVEYFLAL